MNIYLRIAMSIPRQRAVFCLLFWYTIAPLYGGQRPDRPCSPPGASATASGVLSCVIQTVNLAGGSAAQGVTYAWTGPAGFSSAAQSPVVSQAGTYTLVVESSDGCTSVARVVVQEDRILPAVSVKEPDLLRCTVTSVSLSASSSVVGASYHWTGPNGYTATEQNPITTIPGSYTVTVTKPASGCTASAVAVVQENMKAPGSVEATASGVLSCAAKSVTVTGTSDLQGAHYRWEGPNGFTAKGQQPAVREPGYYTLTVTNVVSGCSSSAVVSVSQNIAAPDADTILASPGFVLDDKTTAITLSSVSSARGATYRWKGPNGYAVDGALAIVTAPGSYVFAVTGANGCTTEKTQVVSLKK